MSIEIDRQLFHEVMCQALGIGFGHGSQVAVARALDVARSQYNQVLQGKGASLDLLASWAHQLGVNTLVLNGRAVFVVRGLLDEGPKPPGQGPG